MALFDSCRAGTAAFRIGSFALLFVLVSYNSQAVLPAGNPIDATIPLTSWSLELEDVLTIPNSSGQAPRLEQLVAGGAPGLAYVLDQRGKIYSFDPLAANPSSTLFLDLSAVVPDFNVDFQTGLRGMAFHPDFNNPGTDGYQKFYTSHSRNAFAGGIGSPKFFNSPPGLDHDSVVGEWMVNANGTVNTSSYRELMRIGQPQFDHNIGAIGFNPLATAGQSEYGKLYIALGDGGGAGDPNNTAQNISTNVPNSGGKGFPHGSILRIDPIASGNDPYSIPNDNPFAGVANTIEEVWAYGLRNPHKFSWDPVSEKMLIADIGQLNVEEINLGQAGANYGWSEREGTFELASTNFVDTLPASHVNDALTYPVAQYDHDFDNNNSVDALYAVTGGFVYRGDAVPALRGKYFFGDFSETENALFVTDVDQLVQREDFTDLENLNDGLLAPIEAVQLTVNGVSKSFLQIVRDASGNQSLGRSDLRYGLGPDNEIYVLNKRDGRVRRFSSVSGLVEGDFNGDGEVDAADYTVWRDGLGDKYSQADYQVWVDNYGFSSSSTSTTTAIPEPSAALLMMIAGSVFCVDSRR